MLPGSLPVLGQSDGRGRLADGNARTGDLAAGSGVFGVWAASAAPRPTPSTTPVHSRRVIQGGVYGQPVANTSAHVLTSRHALPIVPCHEEGGAHVLPREFP